MNLPDVVHIDILKINRNINKICKCINSQYTIDTTNRAVYCKCGSYVDPYDALFNIARKVEKVESEVNYALERKKEIIKYQYRTTLFKELERNHLKSKCMLPTCPHCHEAIQIEKLLYGTWVNEKYANRKNKQAGD